MEKITSPTVFTSSEKTSASVKRLVRGGNIFFSGKGRRELSNGVRLRGQLMFSRGSVPVVCIFSDYGRFVHAIPTLICSRASIRSISAGNRSRVCSRYESILVRCPVDPGPARSPGPGRCSPLSERRGLGRCTCFGELWYGPSATDNPPPFARKELEAPRGTYVFKGRRQPPGGTVILQC